MGVRDRLKEELDAKARGLGFHAFGVAPAVVPAEHLARFERWLDDGLAGGMTYLEEGREKRRHLDSVLPGAQSVLCMLVDHRQLASWYPEPEEPPPGVHGKVARYARGRDYHIVLRKRLAKLESFLKERVPAVRTRVCVDSAPVLERVLAWRAGLGFFGKNTLLITPGLGSYTLLGLLVTDLALPSDEPAGGTCGRCTRCLKACPTGAFPEAFRLDVARCLSYWNIEHRGELPEEIDLHGWAFGCDACQEVCPYNREGTPQPLGEDFRSPRASGALVTEEDYAGLDKPEFHVRHEGTPVMRPGHAGMQRNLRRLVRTTSVGAGPREGPSRSR